NNTKIIKVNNNYEQTLLYNLLIYNKFLKTYYNLIDQIYYNKKNFFMVRTLQILRSFATPLC
ncbi:hypothetical protein DA717_05865, partial [Piscirickettsiaceae bacterium NZ-RLO2]